MIKKINLLRFDGSGEGNGDGGNAGTDGGSQTSNAANYTYEQLNEIADSRAKKATRAALADFFRKQGMSEDEVTSAINDFKAKKAASQPNVSEIEKERDEYKQEAEKYKNKEKLEKLNVSSEFMDFVLFKVQSMVTDKLPFEKAAEQFIKENPKYAGVSSTYKVSTGTTDGNGGASTETRNEAINNTIRAAFGRN